LLGCYCVSLMEEVELHLGFLLSRSSSPTSCVLKNFILGMPKDWDQAQAVRRGTPVLCPVVSRVVS